MLNIKIVSWSLGLFTAISFVLCVIYGLIVPPSLGLGKDKRLIRPDPQIVFAYDVSSLANGQLAK